MRVSKPFGKFAYSVILMDACEPSCYHEAISVQDHAKWKHAMPCELDSIHKNGTWDSVPLP